MKKAYRILQGGLASVSIISGTALGERVLDPFERYTHEYEIEGPKHQSEVFYVSVNAYDNEGKHNDRVGDGLLLIMAASGLGSLALSLTGDEADPTPLATVTELHPRK